MLTVFLIMALGLLTGWLLREKKIPYLGKVINFFIWILLFLLGVEVGGDERIVKGIASLGMEGLVIAITSVMGSCLFAMLLWKLASIGHNKGD